MCSQDSRFTYWYRIMLKRRPPCQNNCSFPLVVEHHNFSFIWVMTEKATKDIWCPPRCPRQLVATLELEIMGSIRGMKIWKHLRQWCTITTFKDDENREICELKACRGSKKANGEAYPTNGVQTVKRNVTSHRITKRSETKLSIIYPS